MIRVLRSGAVLRQMAARCGDCLLPPPVGLIKEKISRILGEQYSEIPALFAFQNHSRQRLKVISHNGQRHGSIKCFAVV